MARPTLSYLDPYQYLPLQTPTSLRLVRREGEDDNGFVKISLITIDLDVPLQLPPYGPRPSAGVERPSFHCLSYSWDNPMPSGNGFEQVFESHKAEYDPENTFEINCDGRLLRIRKNLHDFFCQAPTGWTSSIRNRHRQDTGETLLHSRATGDPAILHTYVGQGDDVNALDFSNQTPLHRAASTGNLENVKILLKGGATISLRDNGNQTAQDLADQNGHQEVLDLLQSVSSGDTTALDSVPFFKVESSDQYIWIDAISINQADLEEKASQVQLMDRIYSEAAYIIVWLGAQDEFTTGAVSAVSKLAAHGQDYADSDLIPYRTYDEAMYEERRLPYISQSEWDSLAALFLRRWFSRIWVLQETVMATGIVMYCGSTKISWNDLETITEIMAIKKARLGYDPSTLYVPVGEIASGIEHYFRQMSNLRESARQILESGNEDDIDLFDLQELAYNTIPFKSTDPRDKLYALLSLDSIRPDSDNDFQPDYNIPPSQCFAIFAKHIFAKTGSLNMLAYVHDQSRRKTEALPSWVPDFALNGFSPLFWTDSRPAGDLSADHLSLNDLSIWNELVVNGVCFDEIVNTAASRSLDGPSKFDWDSSWFDLLQTLLQTNRYQPQGISLSEVLWRTLCTDMHYNRTSPAPEHFGGMFKTFLCALICSAPEAKIREELETRDNAIRLFGLLHTATTTAQDGHELEPRGPDEDAMSRIGQQIPPPSRTLESDFFADIRPTLSTLKLFAEDHREPFLPSIQDIADYFASGAPPLQNPDKSLHVPDEISPFLLSYSAVYGGRRLFSSKKGFLGLGASSVEVGDSIWLLPGSAMPVILRPLREDNASNSNRFSFIGAAYVHRAMKGEEAKSFSENDFQRATLI